ncbi:hypothetical protein NL676_024049 [Syzygium grande]|nr:hypothetical protein NL676_024049 [Syzygium grande]
MEIGHETTAENKASESGNTRGAHTGTRTLSTQSGKLTAPSSKPQKNTATPILERPERISQHATQQHGELLPPSPHSRRELDHSVPTRQTPVTKMKRRATAITPFRLGKRPSQRRSGARRRSSETTSETEEGAEAPPGQDQFTWRRGGERVAAEERAGPSSCDEVELMRPRDAERARAA